MEEERDASILLKVNGNQSGRLKLQVPRSNTEFCFEGQGWQSRRERPSWEACK